MFMLAKDDMVTLFKVVPIDDLERNPNFLIAISDAGGHCEWFYKHKNGQYQRYTPQVVL